MIRCATAARRGARALPGTGLALLAMACIGPAPADEPAPAATVEHAEPELPVAPEGVLYALGVYVGAQFELLDVDEQEVDEIVRGMRHASLGLPLEGDPIQIGDQINAFRAERIRVLARRERLAGLPYLEEARREEGARETESGLIWTELEVGEGESPTLEQWVRVHYHGVHRDGRVFDSTLASEPRTFMLVRTMRCWKEALQMMAPGGRAKLVCPPGLAYGEAGAPPRVRGGEVLTFEVELLEVRDEK